MSSAWDGDWKQRIQDRVRALGHESPAAFAEAHPAASFLELADILGPDVAAVQLVWTLRRAAEEEPRALEQFARSCLYRQIRRRIRQGWKMSAEEPFVYGAWHTDLSEDYEAPADRVWDALDELAPKGWVPDGPDDPVLLKAFERWNGGT